MTEPVALATPRRKATTWIGLVTLMIMVQITFTRNQCQTTDFVVDDKRPQINNASTNSTIHNNTTTLTTLTTDRTPPEPTASSQKPQQPFTGSKITPLSLGVDLFEHVCLTKADSKDMVLLSYTEEAVDLHSTLNYHKKQVDALHGTQGRPLKQWYTDTQKWPLIQGDTLLAQPLFSNPGHCISDYMMPLIRDRYERHTLPKTSSPEYPHWLQVHWRHIKPYEPHHYCNQLLQAADFVQEQGYLPSSEPACFERLFIPATEQLRYPFNQEMIPIAKEEMELGGHKLLIIGGANLTVTPYPSEALYEFRQTLWHNLGLKSEPWTEQEIQKGGGPHIFFYNRFGSKHRHWNSSFEVAEILEHGYHVKVDIVGAEWNDFNFTQQAAQYNAYSHIVTVHGAHLANLIFSRPRTQVVEIVPIVKTRLRANESLTRRQDASNPRDWYGPLGWFSAFSRQVGIEHFSLHAEDHIHNIARSNKGMDINATRAAAFIASRFGLQLRRETVANV
ncbi:expressed unknown protein [Seminavis robusta]|uniref:Glycosyltransferase 61 catalytic domain-containing protein n=1 Tax=Seminavis robusta TaxID=568900 RepID=A0A9N8DEA0_9STRA|nr:expressed unknown protein [Seminavis robusta]|eukprot:Sro48_g028400.1 n/a (504) ;mRNA; r:137277-138788